MKLVLATKNKNKIDEIKALTRDIPVEILTLEDFPALVLPPEEARSFIENALEKARFVARRTGLTALADDSGLEVAELGGRPGVRSSRYAGEGATDKENNEKLLRELSGVGAETERRKARFVCVIALVEPSGHEVSFEGTCEGVIGTEPRGSYGFGYDPLFIVDEGGKTMAELPPAEKNKLSHRARAIERLKEWLQKNVRV
jgi:XTP/dITP diphosphohydrolase